MSDQETILKQFHDDNYTIAGLRINSAEIDIPIETFDTVYGHYVSLEQFVIGLGFDVEYDLFSNNMQGWIYDPKNIFLYDHKKRIFTVGKQKVLIPDDQIVIYQNELYLHIKQIPKIFDIEYDYQPQTLIMQLYSEKKTPAEIQYELDKKMELLSTSQVGKKRKALTADIAYDYELLSIPMVEAKLKLSYDYEDSTNINTDTGNQYNSSIEAYIRNHMLYMQSKLYINNNIDSDDDVDSRLFTLYRTGSHGKTFSQLNLAALAIGDVSSNVGNGIGFKISNDIGTSSLTFDKIDIRGTGYTDWRVELYVNNILIDIDTIDSVGRYEFQNVALAFGNNYVEILKYGPHGEIEKEIRNYNIDDNLLQSNNLVFNLEYVAEDSFLLSNNSDNVNDNIYLKIGHRLNETNSLFYEKTLQYDTEDSDTVTLITSLFDAANFISYSRNYFNDTEVYDIESLFELYDDTLEISLNYILTDYDDYYNQSLISSVSKDLYSTSIKLGSKFERYFSTDEYLFLQDYSLDIGNVLAYNIKLYNNFDYTDNAGVRTATVQTNANKITANKIYSANMNHDLYPEVILNNVSVGYYQKLEHKRSYDLTFSYNADDWSIKNSLFKDYYTILKLGTFIDYHNTGSETIFGFSLDINGSLFAAHSPYSAHKVGAALNVNTDSGVLGVRAFIDENANHIFDESDTPLKGLRFGGVTNTYPTNKDGITYLTNMSPNYVYSINTNYDTLEYPEVVAEKEPLYISVVPSKVNYVNFMFSYLGSIDGNLYIAGKPIPHVEMILTTLDGEIVDEFSTEQDGFFYFPDISAGKYILKLSERSYKKYQMVRPLEVPIEISKNNLFAEYLRFDITRHVSRKVRNYFSRNAGDNIVSSFGSKVSKADLIKIVPKAKFIPKRYKSILMLGQNNDDKGTYEVQLAKSLSKQAIVKIMANLKHTYPQIFYALDIKIRSHDEEQKHIYKLKTVTGYDKNRALKYCKKLHKKKIPCVVQKEFSLGKFQTKYDLINYQQQLVMPIAKEHQQVYIKRNVEETQKEINSIKTKSLKNSMQQYTTYLGGINYELIILESDLLDRSVEKFCRKNRKKVKCSVNYIASYANSNTEPPLDLNKKSNIVMDVYDLDQKDGVFYKLFVGEFKDESQSYDFCKSLGITKDKCNIFNRTKTQDNALLQ